VVGALTTRVQIVSILLLLCSALCAQDQNTDANKSNPFTKGLDHLFNYLNMAGTEKAAEFKPMTQSERNHFYYKSMVNPFTFVKAGLSAGIDQWNDKPTEWGQGVAGYGKRYGNILGQYWVQKTVTYGLSSALHEDNRYFNSGKHGFWPRVAYALESGILARHDNGTRHISISQIGGTAAGAFVARAWLPPSQSSAEKGAISFGVTLASNAGFGIVKELLPDIGRKLSKKQKEANEANRDTW